jgi:hypothetical protein
MANVYKVDQRTVWQAFSTHKWMTCIYCDVFTSAVAINCSYRCQYVGAAGATIMQRRPVKGQCGGR